MNRALVKRLINEYLDGEIGLADKARLEQLMADNPEIRREYEELRQIGMKLGTLPDIAPHPVRLRARVQEALEVQSNAFFTPQRVFAGAMMVALGVISISFALLMFQELTLGSREELVVPSIEADVQPGESFVVLDAHSTADRFFSRVLIQHELGMIDHQVLGTLMMQSTVFEGAVCTDDSLNSLRLAYPPRALQLRVVPSVAVQLSKIAEEVSGTHCRLAVREADGTMLDLEQYLRANRTEQMLNLLIRFD